METVILLLCLLCQHEPGCHCELDAHVTWYAPEMGDAVNCMGDCKTTGFGTPVIYGETAACGPSWPWNTVIYVPELDLWRRCQDHGGAIMDDEVDIAVPLDECYIQNTEPPFCWHPLARPDTIRTVLWFTDGATPENLIKQRRDTHGENVDSLAGQLGILHAPAARHGVQ